MSTVIDSIERDQLQRRPSFGAGDRVRVHFQVVEGSRKRTQVFEGIVIKRQGAGARETFTVRKHSFGVGVERTFPLHSPKVEKLEVAARGDVRRAKLYYLRDKVGKQSRVAERRWGIEDELVIASDEAEAVDAEGVAVSEAEAEVTDEAEPEAGDDAEPETADASEAETAAADASEAEEKQASEAPAEDDQADEAPADQADEAPAEDEQPESRGDAKADEAGQGDGEGDAPDDAEADAEQPSAEKADG